MSASNPVERWQARLEETGRLTPEIVDRITRIHDDRGARAIEAVGEGRVKAYQDFTIVVGYEDEYIVEDGGCTCKDYEYNLDADDPTDLCWHILAVAIARRIGHVDYHDMWYSEVRELL
ncbi:SWIM zinc finger family protein [Halobacteria archaeon AArc-dxtr1]|nr:SWIM zinc finger family protein [Halobacteria archaeon AArc-dxtr1]